MGTMTPAQRRALYESARFARETTYNGPLVPSRAETEQFILEKGEALCS